MEKFNNDQIQVDQIYPYIYHLTFTSSYDMAMHFLRFQEYYESPKFYRQFFTIIDYMEWYAKDYEQANGAFTYPRDWGGFNVPSHCLLPFLEKNVIPDPNKYDAYMLDLIRFIKSQVGEHPFYLIGSPKSNNTQVLDHEVAHAWYTVDSEYRESVNHLLEELPKEILNKARNFLNNNNYHHTTIDDEIHAYCSTGLSFLRGVIPHEQTTHFLDLFQKTKEKYEEKLKKSQEEKEKINKKS